MMALLSATATLVHSVTNKTGCDSVQGNSCLQNSCAQSPCSMLCGLTTQYNRCEQNCHSGICDSLRCRALDKCNQICLLSDCGSMTCDAKKCIQGQLPVWKLQQHDVSKVRKQLRPSFSEWDDLWGKRLHTSVQRKRMPNDLSSWREKLYPDGNKIPRNYEMRQRRMHPSLYLGPVQHELLLECEGMSSNLCKWRKVPVQMWCCKLQTGLRERFIVH